MNNNKKHAPDLKKKNETKQNRSIVFSRYNTKKKDIFMRPVYWYVRENATQHEAH